MSQQYYFTSESVCAGHPDKLSDQISDAIADEIIKQDPFARIAVETAVTAGRVVLLGEVGSAIAKVDYAQVARDDVRRQGYVIPELQFDANNLAVDVYIREQSPEIAAGVVNNDDEGIGAGDQGMMFGFACNETPQLMPLPVTLAHRLTQRIDELRVTDLQYLRPDGKAQVTVAYENGKPVAVNHVVVAVPHDPSVTREQVQQDIYEKGIAPLLAEFGYKIDPQKDLVLNGTGVWHFSGPAADAGLTGRKIIVDTYGGYARVGGGAFSGKDCTKVDRSAAYAARYLAKNIVAAGLADKAEVALAYFIGARKPVMQEVETFGTEKVGREEIKKFINELLDTSVSGIIKAFDLRRPIYRETAAYGHFGREGFPWEEVVAKK